MRDTPRAARSLSAITWCVKAPTHGLPLTPPNAFFAEVSSEVSHAVLLRLQVPAAPTVYLCPRDRGHSEVGGGTPARAEAVAA